MIKDTKSISMVESIEFIDKKSEQGAKAIAFISKFSEIKPKDAKEMRTKIEDLKLIKLNDYHTTKIIDLLPENAEEVNKIFTDVSLDEDETKKIIDIVKQYK
jgi:DNA-directed RNA polymerase subunit F